jgi:hypothetical protein
MSDFALSVLANATLEPSESRTLNPDTSVRWCHFCRVGNGNSRICALNTEVAEVTVHTKERSTPIQNVPGKRYASRISIDRS